MDIFLLLSPLSRPALSALFLSLSPSHSLSLFSRGHSVSTRGTPLRAREWRLSRLARPFQRAGAIPSFLPASLPACLPVCPPSSISPSLFLPFHPLSLAPTLTCLLASSRRLPSCLRSLSPWLPDCFMNLVVFVTLYLPPPPCQSLLLGILMHTRRRSCSFNGFFFGIVSYNINESWDLDILCCTQYVWKFHKLS